MLSLVYLLVFFLGTIIGSFLNVVIYRFNTGKTIGGRSICMSCNKTLRWFELIPLVSFFLQNRHCRRCGALISYQYPIVEAITGIVFALIVWKWNFLLPGSISFFLEHTIYAMFMFSLLIVISIYDLRHQIIPDFLVYVFTFIALFATCFSVFGFSFPTIWQSLSGLIIALPFFLLWYFSHGKLMGFGDIKLMIGIGYFLGLERGSIALIFSFWIGALVSVLLLLFVKDKYSLRSKLAFGPFLVLATILVYICGITFSSLFGFFM